MLFTELRFFAFFLVAYAVYWALPRNGWRKTWLLAGSYVFYGAWDWRFLGLILASTLTDYAVGLALERSEAPGRRKALLVTSLAVNLGLLGFFKYFDFFVSSAVELLNAIGIGASERSLGVVLPVGISFYTFQTLSYSIDVYGRRMPATRSLRDFALFVAFFPQLVAGPIVRASQFLPQLAAKRRFADVAFRAHLVLFAFGFVKKACVSDNFAILSDRIFADPAGYGILDLWLGAALYTVQIYCDFSGYSDMAIATAGLLGYRLVLNFDFPYLAVSVTDFWRRWHMSLGAWLRDYLYIPLGGNRVSPGRTYANLVTVFALCGLWHGADWAYVVWGLFHGVFLIVERRLSDRRGFDPLRASAPRRAYTLWVWLMSMVLLRLGEIGPSLAYVRGMYDPSAGAGLGHVAGVDPRWWLLIAAFGIVHRANHRLDLEGRLARVPAPAFAAGLGAACALALPFLPADYQPFIYFQF